MRTDLRVGERPPVNDIPFLNALLRKVARSTRLFFWALSLVLVLGVGPATEAWQEARREQIQTEAIPQAEFSRIISDFSEDDGFFRSDNFISNETSYLHVVEKLRDLAATGGAYIGVGPEQNFTYISKIRPRIAFIIDIRRQAMIQHLMFKAIFHLAENRAQFLSLLFSKPVIGEGAPGGNARLEEILNYFLATASSEELFDSNLASLRRIIEQDFKIALSPRDVASLEYVYTTFREENLNLQYRSAGGTWSGYHWGRFPTLKELLMEEDLHGNQRSFLAGSEDYDFVRGMHRNNRIIPVVGDFAGSKALAAVGDYLRKNGYSVAVFYTSNVEQYLFANGVFGKFAENVRKLPINEKSLFIRSFPNLGEPHPARISGHRLTTLLQKMTVFLQDYDQHLYTDYQTLVTTHFIAGNDP